MNLRGINAAKPRQGKALGVLFVLAPAATVALGVLWSLGMLVFRDEKMPGYMQAGSFVSVALPILLAAVLAAFGVLALLMRGLKDPGVEEASPAAFFATGAVGLLAAAHGAVILISRVGSAGMAALPYAAGAVLLLLLAAGLLCRPLLLCEGARLRSLWQGLMLLGVLGCLCLSLAGYFDGLYPVNAPGKWTEQIFFLVLSFWLLTEVGMALGRPLWGASLALSGALLTVGLSFGVGDVLLFVTGGGCLRATLVSPFLFLFCGILAAVRLGSVCRYLLRGESRVLEAVPKVECSNAPCEEQSPDSAVSEEPRIPFGQQTFDLAPSQSGEGEESSDEEDTAHE